MNAQAVVLHIKEYAPGLGPDICKCTRCGKRLWLPADGTYTTDRVTFDNPPPGYISCAQQEREP